MTQPRENKIRATATAVTMAAYSCVGISVFTCIYLLYRVLSLRSLSTREEVFAVVLASLALLVGGGAWLALSRRGKKAVILLGKRYYPGSPTYITGEVQRYATTHDMRTEQCHGVQDAVELYVPDIGSFGDVVPPAVRLLSRVGHEEDGRQIAVRVRLDPCGAGGTLLEVRALLPKRRVFLGVLDDPFERAAQRVAADLFAHLDRQRLGRV